jgi:hypothetical protein
MLIYLLPILLITSLAAVEDCDALFRDLSLVAEIDKKEADSLPFNYNFSMMGGYFNMPSGRMPNEGVAGFGAARVHPYNVYGLSFQYFDRIELSANYRVYTGITEKHFGHEGFGDDADRIGNIKLAINIPGDGMPEFPIFAVGADDFIGTKRFNSQYVVVTQQWISANVEATLGWGRKRIKGLFGGLAWTPWRQTGLFFFKDLTFMAEYDAVDYKHHPWEHPRGRDVKSRINAGVSYVLGDTLQLTASSLRGKYFAASGSLRYPLGTTKGFIAKSKNPLLYRSPIDTEPLGVTRPKEEFAHELAYALGAQGLDLYRVYLKDDQTLWIKIVNNMFREECEVRERLERALAALIPSEIKEVVVVDEADALPCHSYRFRTEDLYKYREGIVGDFEMQTLAPMSDVIGKPSDSERLFRRTKDIWTFTFRPRVLTFFGSAKGKVKYNVALVANPEGYFFDDILYQAQLTYQVKSSIQHLETRDRLNPSHLLNVRTDTLKYFQSNTVSLEMAYLQKGWNIGKGWYARLGGGYFEPAYGGVAAEILYYPAKSNWAIGIEEATLLKRRYKGLAFTRRIRKYKGDIAHFEHYLGVQYFLDLHYTLKPWDVDIKVMVGQFLAKDRGARFEMNKWFQSGLQVSLWYTMTNGHDKIGGYTYHDKGFAFAIPLDFFLRQSSRTYVGYAMSAWLRDVGAIGETGRQLYQTLRLERAYTR